MALWDKISSQGNVEDRRGSPAMIGGGVSLIGIVMVVAFSLLSGSSGSDTLNQVLSQLATSQPTATTSQQGEFEDPSNYRSFASAVLGSSNDLWRSVFSNSELDYREPRLVLFRQATESACGYAQSEAGPHYCPGDETIYLDETFFDELQNRFGAKGGDVAEAYVIAHEVGHHVQNQLGILDAVQEKSGYYSGLNNQESINLELQADCFAGVWANSVAHLGVIEDGEINEALDAAAAVGDDNIQSSTTGRISPESWTHGSSAERQRWFRIGFDSGNPAECSTFSD